MSFRDGQDPFDIGHIGVIGYEWELPSSGSLVGVDTLFRCGPSVFAFLDDPKM
jgi:hypothetical protein